jgi:hypothetical protein
MRTYRSGLLVLAVLCGAVGAVATASVSATTTGFIPLDRPARLVDTRPGTQTADGRQQGEGLRAAGSVTPVQVGGRAGLGSAPPVVVLNVTVTGSQAGGYVTVWPCGARQPNASNVNFAAGQTIANQVIAKVGTQGRVCVFTSAATHVLVDAAGTFTGDAAPAMLAAPARLLDSRAGVVPAAGSTLRVPVRGEAGVGSNAQVALLNVTVTDARAAGYVTVWPCGTAQPNASNVNFAAGDTIANAVTARIGTGGEVCVFTSAAAHLLVDVAGASSSTTTLRMLTTPARVLDTRPGTTTVDGRRAGAGLVGRSGAVALEVAGRAGVPATAAAVLLNVTATGPLGGGYLTVHSCGTAQPNASNVNFAAGQTIAGSVMARVGVDGKVRLFASEATHVLVDVAGWIDRAPGEAAPQGTAPCADVIGELPDSGAGLADVTVKVTRREAGTVWFEVTDTSGRNLTADSAAPAPTLSERTIYVKAHYPAGANGLPTATVMPRLATTGTYRNGPEPDGCNPSRSRDEVFVCVGFPLMGRETPTQVGFRDIPNQAVDISQVIDVILADPTLVGRVSLAKLTYSGGSMGGITGMFLLHPLSRDNRFVAIESTVGFAPPWVAAFSDPATWAGGPKVLMQNTLNDNVITYELARLTYENANSPNLTLITYFEGGHSIPDTCPAAGEYVNQWWRHAVEGGPAPNAGLLVGSTCAALGVRPGGTTGWGAAEGFRPR